MAANIKTKTGRTALTARREPYWERIRAGLYVGFRKLEAGDGTWIARRYEDGKQRYNALGHAVDFDVAQRAALEWNAELEQGVTETGKTVEDVCRAYVEHRKTANSAASAKDAEGRFQRLIYGKSIGKLPLAKLKTTDLRKWLNEQIADEDDEDPDAVRRSKDSANRNLNTTKAALNMALRDRLIATDAGWKTVVPFAKVGKRREYLLTASDRKALLDNLPDDLRAFVKALLLTAARPGEIAKAKAGDFDKLQGTLTLVGKTGRRTVPLSTAAKSFFGEAAKDKLPTAPLFTTQFGGAWNKDSWKKPFKEAIKSAGLPTGVVAYHLRHAAISEMLVSGMQTSIVAMLAGTSTSMIDRHYGHLCHDQTRAALDRIAMI